jgi:hypothetical protein
MPYLSDDAGVPQNGPLVSRYGSRPFRFGEELAAEASGAAVEAASEATIVAVSEADAYTRGVEAVGVAVPVRIVCYL